MIDLWNYSKKIVYKIAGIAINLCTSSSSRATNKKLKLNFERRDSLKLNVEYDESPQLQVAQIPVPVETREVGIQHDVPPTIDEEFEKLLNITERLGYMIPVSKLFKQKHVDRVIIATMSLLLFFNFYFVDPEDVEFMSKITGLPFFGVLFSTHFFQTKKSLREMTTNLPEIEKAEIIRIFKEESIFYVLYKRFYLIIGGDSKNPHIEMKKLKKVHEHLDKFCEEYIIP